MKKTIELHEQYRQEEVYYCGKIKDEEEYVEGIDIKLSRFWDNEENDWGEWFIDMSEHNELYNKEHIETIIKVFKKVE